MLASNPIQSKVRQLNHRLQPSLFFLDKTVLFIQIDASSLLSEFFAKLRMLFLVSVQILLTLVLYVVTIMGDSVCVN